MRMSALMVAAAWPAVSRPIVTMSAVTNAQPGGAPATTLRPAGSFSSIADARERSVALFQEAAKVLQHPRCVNCHPRGDRPMQTDRMRPHEPLVVRGADGHGAPALACKTCHGDANYDPARVPGRSALASRAAIDGLGGHVARRDLRADQGPDAQWQQDHGRHSSIT